MTYTATCPDDAIMLDVDQTTGAQKYVCTLASDAWPFVEQDSAGGGFLPPLSSAEGLQIGSAVLGLWVVMWLFKQARRAIQ